MDIESRFILYGKSDLAVLAPLSFLVSIAWIKIIPIPTFSSYPVSLPKHAIDYENR